MSDWWQAFAFGFMMVIILVSTAATAEASARARSNAERRYHILLWIFALLPSCAVLAWVVTW